MRQADLRRCMHGSCAPYTQQHVHLSCCCVDDSQRRLSATHASDSTNSTARLCRHAHPIDPPRVRTSEPRPRPRRMSDRAASPHQFLSAPAKWGP